MAKKQNPNHKPKKQKVEWRRVLFGGLAAVLALRKTHPDWRRPVSMPGGRITAVCGILASVFLAGNLLVPFSPGALNGLEYALAAALAVLGLVLYHFRDRSLSDTERARRILGAAPKGDSNGEEAGKTV